MRQVDHHLRRAEIGQGFVTIARQIAHEVLGVTDVLLKPANTSEIGSAGSSAASRQTYMSGKAIEMACRKIAEQVREKCAEHWGEDAGKLSCKAIGCAPMTDVSMWRSRTPVANRSRWRCSSATGKRPEWTRNRPGRR